MRLNRPVDFLVSLHLCGDRLNDLCRKRNESSKWSYQRMIALLSRFLTPLLVLGIGLCWIALTRSGLVLTPPLAPEPIVPFFGLVWLDSILIKEMFSSFNCASSNACMKVVGLSSSTPPQLSSFRPTMKNSTKKSSGRLGIWLDNVQTLFGSKKWFTFVVANPVGALNWRMNECPHLRLTLV